VGSCWEKSLGFRLVLDGRDCGGWSRNCISGRAGNLDLFMLRMNLHFNSVWVDLKNHVTALCSVYNGIVCEAHEIV
jgi:hypothetical protein